jgi:hypothetical protein
MFTIPITVTSRVPWRAHYSPSSHRWIGICDPMNLTMEADSLDELHSVINEAIQLMFRDLLEDKELDAYLTGMGWTAGPLPLNQPPEVIEFDLPWELIAEGARDLARRAP